MACLLLDDYFFFFFFFATYSYSLSLFSKGVKLLFEVIICFFFFFSLGSTCVSLPGFSFFSEASYRSHLFFFLFHSLLLMFFFFSSLLLSAWAHNTPFLFFHMYASVSQKHQREREQAKENLKIKEKEKCWKKRDIRKGKAMRISFTRLVMNATITIIIFVLFCTLHPLIPFQCGCFSVFFNFFFVVVGEKKKKLPYFAFLCSYLFI